MILCTKRRFIQNLVEVLKHFYKFYELITNELFNYFQTFNRLNDNFLSFAIEVL